METIKSPSLQQKLQLLSKLRQGKLQESQQLMSKIAKSTKTNQQLYNKFYDFLSQHRQQIQQMNQQEKQVQEKVVFVEGSDQDWLTDDSVSFSSQQDEKEEKVETKKRLFKNVSNSKSSVLIKTKQEALKPFFVATKAKENTKSYKTLIPMNNPSCKIDTQNIKTQETTTKSQFLPKIQKNHQKPYFPQINGAKSTLKLTKK